MVEMCTYQFRFMDNSTQNWSNYIHDNSICKMYMLFTSAFGFEKNLK